MKGAISSNFVQVLFWLIQLGSPGNQNYVEDAPPSPFELGRSFRNVYILLLGTTGVGKDTAINFLFGNNTRMEGIQSATPNIHEYRIPITTDEIGMTSPELRIIDTPGFSSRLLKDSATLATLDEYLTNHEDLKDNIPNSVLVFHQFTENYSAAEIGNFIVMIRALNCIHRRITDENYTTVIFLFSYLYSETKETQYRKEPYIRLELFRYLIEKYSLFPKSVVMAVVDKDAMRQPLMRNGYDHISNNKQYSKNLLKIIKKQFENNGDINGQHILQSAIESSVDLNVLNITHQIFPIQETSSMIGYYKNVLMSSLFDVMRSEIWLHLRKVWKRKIDSNLKLQFPESLAQLQMYFSKRNIKKLQEVPRKTAEILELLYALNQNEAMTKLLKIALNIEVPQRFPESFRVGYGYNVVQDSPIPISPFNINDALDGSQFGFVIPKVLVTKLDLSWKIRFHLFETEFDYRNSRWDSLGIATEPKSAFFKWINSSLRFTDIKPGNNIKKFSMKRDSCSLNAVWETSFFELVLNENADLTPKLKQDIRMLPLFNNSDSKGVLKWLDFFQKYGTHVVKSARGGGWIEIVQSSDQPFNTRIAEQFYDLVHFVDDEKYITPIAETILGTAVMKNETKVGALFPPGVNYTLTFYGGNPEYYISDILSVSLEEASTLLTNWKNSIKFNSTILDSEVKLVPISKILKGLGQNYSVEIDRAASVLFNAN